LCKQKNVDTDIFSSFYRPIQLLYRPLQLLQRAVKYFIARWSSFTAHWSLARAVKWYLNFPPELQSRENRHVKKKRGRQIKYLENNR
jgi:hypothetical protein